MTDRQNRWLTAVVDWPRPLLTFDTNDVHAEADGSAFTVRPAGRAKYVLLGPAGGATPSNLGSTPRTMHTTAEGNAARLWSVYSLHATKKLRDRAKPPILPAVADPTTCLGNWYGTVLFWRPQLALLVNEQTLFPVLMALAPAATVLDRFPAALSQTLAAAGVERRFIDSELAEMSDGQWTKTASRSVLGTMNEFSFLANDYHHHHDFDPMGLALWLAQTPCGPLYGRHISPDRELAAAVELWSTEQYR